MLRDLELYFQENHQRFISEWSAFLRFRSVSTAEEKENDCRACAEWLAEHLQMIGFQESKIIETDGQALVYAYHPGFLSGPSTLYYGHYDVYDAGDSDAWTSPPFSPEVREGRMYARGAEDNKGQTFFVLKAAEYLIREKLLGGPLRILIEGEEETTTSTSLFAKLPSLQELLRSDQLLVCDTDSHSLEEPSIVLGLRGIAHMTFAIHGPERPLHSGVYGGVIENPAVEAARLINSFHKQDGSIAVDGFLDGMKLASKDEMRLAELSCPSAESIFQETGSDPLLSRDLRSIAQKRGFLPTIEVCAIRSGLLDTDDVQTTIPCTAEVSVTMRLVAGQEPSRCLAALESHLRSRLGPTFRMEVLRSGVGGPGLRLPLQSFAVQRAALCLQELTGRIPRFAWEGMSVPVLPSLLSGFAKEAVLVGFGLDDDNTHGPDESFSLEQLRLGFLFASLFLAGQSHLLDDGAGI